MQERGKESSQCNDSLENDKVCQGWEVLVYVRSSDYDADKLKSEYLQYVGGQLNAVCASHGFLLVFT